MTLSKHHVEKIFELMKAEQRCSILKPRSFSISHYLVKMDLRDWVVVEEDKNKFVLRKEQTNDIMLIYKNLWKNNYDLSSISSFPSEFWVWKRIELPFQPFTELARRGLENFSRIKNPEGVRKIASSNFTSYFKLDVYMDVFFLDEFSPVIRLFAVYSGLSLTLENVKKVLLKYADGCTEYEKLLSLTDKIIAVRENSTQLLVGALGMNNSQELFERLGDAFPMMPSFIKMTKWEKQEELFIEYLACLYASAVLKKDVYNLHSLSEGELRYLIRSLKNYQQFVKIEREIERIVAKFMQDENLNKRKALKQIRVRLQDFYSQQLIKVARS